MKKIMIALCGTIIAFGIVKFSSMKADVFSDTLETWKQNWEDSASIEDFNQYIDTQEVNQVFTNEQFVQTLKTIFDTNKDFAVVLIEKLIRDNQWEMLNNILDKDQVYFADVFKVLIDDGAWEKLADL